MRYVITAAAILVACPAFAAAWVMDSTKSTLTFTATQSGEKVDGSFKKFTTDIAFDPAKHSGHVHAVINMASLSSDNKDAAEALPTSDWLDVKQFATAEFTADFSQTGRDTNSYAAQGNLTLHGISKPVILAFTLDPQGSFMHAVGTATLNRNDYKIGQGQWADDKWIAYPVTVRFDIYATAK